MATEFFGPQSPGQKTLVNIMPNGAYWVDPAITDKQAAEILHRVVALFSGEVHDRKLAGAFFGKLCSDLDQILVKLLEKHTCTVKSEDLKRAGYCCDAHYRLDHAMTQVRSSIPTIQRMVR